MPAPVEQPPLGWLLTLTATGLEVALPVSASTAVAVTLFELKLAVTPEGIPVALSVIDPGEPLTTEVVTVRLTLDPRATLAEAGLTAMEKSAAGPTATVPVVLRVSAALSVPVRV